MKKIALISTFCDTEEKQNVLLENILKLKNLGLDIMVISPNFVIIKQDIIDLCDFFFYTKENPVLNWPVRAFTFWKTHLSVDGWVKMHRNVGDYGWAALNQIKRLSQIALSHDYDVFYHLIYDLEIDSNVEKEILTNELNIIHPRINPNDPNDLWEATLHFMVFDKDTMVKIMDDIKIENYLEDNGVAEGQALKWTQKHPIKINSHPVKDKIYYWENTDLFNYSQNPEYKMFIGKTDETHPNSNFTPDLRLYLYDFENPQNFKFIINNEIFENNINENRMIEFNIHSFEVVNFKIIDNSGGWDYTKIFNDISRNLIYYGIE